MFSRPRLPPPEDPSVALVEQILETTASRSIGEPTRRDGRLVVTHAISLCACTTEYESPVWLLYAVGEGGIGWERIPDGTHESDVVEAEHITGCHPAPGGVLAWLRNESDWPDSLGGLDFPEDAFIYQELRRRIFSA